MDTPPPTRKDLKREAILSVAAEVFFEDGYQAASMSEIAARVGGSKGTLYNYFDSKEALFEAHVRESCGKIGAMIVDFSDDRPVPEVLRQVGERYLDRIYSDFAIRTYQVIVAECRSWRAYSSRPAPESVMTAWLDTLSWRWRAASWKSPTVTRRPGSSSACAGSTTWRRRSGSRRN